MKTRIKSTLYGVAAWLAATARRLTDMATCHHCLHAVMASTYGASCLHLIDKDLVTQIVMTVYFALALRP